MHFFGIFGPKIRKFFLSLKECETGKFYSYSANFIVIQSGQVSKVNFCKDHRDKTEVPDPLAVENLISYKLTP